MSHGITTVDSMDIMLMPLLSNISEAQFLKLDTVFKALMEYAFIKRVHVMDLMRVQNITSKMLTDTIAGKHNSVTEIVKNYSEGCLSIMEKKDEPDNPIQYNDIRKKGKNDNSLIIATKSMTNESARIRRVSDAERNRPKDIAFVSCGPIPMSVLSRSSTVSEKPKERTFESKNDTISVESPRVRATVSPSTETESPARVSPLRRALSLQTEKLKDRLPSISLTVNEKRTESSTNPAINQTGPRVLTIRSPRSLSISTIMKHLPSDGLKNKKVIVVTSDSKIENKLPMSKTSTVTNDSPVPLLITSIGTPSSSVSQPVLKEKSKSLPASSSIPVNDNSVQVPTNILTQSFSEQMTLHGRVVFQNGRKYLIKHVPKAKCNAKIDQPKVKTVPSTSSAPLVPKTTSAPSNRSLVSTATSASPTLSGPTQIILPNPLQFPKEILLQKPFLLPKPPALPRYTMTNVSPSSGNVAPSPGNVAPSQLHRKRDRVIFPKGKVVVMPSTKNDKRLPSQPIDPHKKMRRSMVKEMQQASKQVKMEHIANLKEITNEYAKTINGDNDSVVVANNQTIQFFEKLPVGSTTQDKTSEDSSPCDEDEFEKSAREWSLTITDADKLRTCATCDKRLKPSTYVEGFSGPADDEEIYCHCYNFVCYKCNVNQGSEAMLKAHVKWHKKEKPFMCPDCSKFYSTAVDLEVHVWTTCFHPMIGYIYGCSICEIDGISDMEAVAKHFLLFHTHKRIICTECRKEFPANNEGYITFRNHGVKAHDRLEDYIPIPKKFFVCVASHASQCVSRAEHFRKHLDVHSGVIKTKYYKCPFCSITKETLGRDENKIRDHLFNNHLERLHEIASPDALPRILKELKERCDDSAKITNTSGPMIVDARSITPASFHQGSESSEELDEPKIPRILDVRSSAFEEFTKIEIENGDDCAFKILSVESMAKDSSQSSVISSEDMKTEPYISEDDESMSAGMENFLTTINNCVDEGNEPSFGYEGSDDSKNSDNSEKKPCRIALNAPTSPELEPVAYNCHLCGELINTSWSVIKAHFDCRHPSEYEVAKISAKIPRISTGFIEGGYRKDSNPTKRKSDVVVAPKRRKRWGAKKSFDRPGSPSLGLCVRPEPVEEVEGSFRCKKCDELFKEMSELRDHIGKQHRIKGQYLICLECGENFVVAPSLQMHLKALHGIQDPITYLSQNTSYAPEILDDTERDEMATESNQCYVCMAVFENKGDLDKHMRVHGMAFLKRKRFEAQKALKSGEKKGEPPDGNRNNSTASADNKTII